MLTNKRVVFEEKKSVITEISLDQIRGFHRAVDGLSCCSTLSLNLDNGEQIHVTFEVLSGGHFLSDESKKITSDFLECIANLIKSLSDLENVWRKMKGIK